MNRNHIVFYFPWFFRGIKSRGIRCIKIFPGLGGRVGFGLLYHFVFLANIRIVETVICLALVVNAGRIGIS